MRAVIQRVQRAEVRVDGAAVSSIGIGLLVLIGIGEGDDHVDARVMAEKLAGLRIFADEAGRMNRSVAEVGGSVMLVSQFTLYGDLRRGRRPSFSGASEASTAEPLVDAVRERLATTVPVSVGRFGHVMEVELVNDGPVTLVLEVQAGRVL